MIFLMWVALQGTIDDQQCYTINEELLYKPENDEEILACLYLKLDSLQVKKIHFFLQVVR